MLRTNLKKISSYFESAALAQKGTVEHDLSFHVGTWLTHKVSFSVSFQLRKNRLN